MYEYLKALHLISVVCWFAGLFYIVRLFIYHTEATEQNEQQRIILQTQFIIMERRLWYGITWPSAISTFIFGFWLIYDSYLPLGDHPWLHTKLLLVFGLFAYHLKCHQIFKELQNSIVKRSSNFLRIWNEVATLFLFAIIFLAVLKTTQGLIYGVAGIICLAVTLMIAIRIYKKAREN